VEEKSQNLIDWTYFHCPGATLVPWWVARANQPSTLWHCGAVKMVWGRGATKDQVNGWILLLISIAFYAYFSFWLIVLPFIEKDFDLIHSLFPSPSYALKTAVVGGIFLLTVLSTLMGLIMIRTHHAWVQNTAAPPPPPPPPNPNFFDINKNPTVSVTYSQMKYPCPTTYTIYQTQSYSSYILFYSSCNVYLMCYLYLFLCTVSM